MATGGTITYDGLYTVHTFNSSGSFVPATTGLSVDVLVGSGGGGGSAAGGGAGGFKKWTSEVLGLYTYTVTIGNGGAGKAGTGTTGVDGGDSSFVGTGHNLYTNGGGGGAKYDCGAGRGGTPRGSGGGAAGCNVANYSYGLGTNPYGYNGGYLNASRAASGWYPSGGGGGWGGASGNTRLTTAGSYGGYGLNDSITGSAVGYGGGGSGGCKWSSGSSNNTPGRSGFGGGTGKCRYQGNGTAGTANKGAGGGGCGYGASGGSGGKGVIIIRYLTADDEPTSDAWFFMNFAILAGAFVNTIGVKLLSFADDMKRRIIPHAWAQVVAWNERRLIKEKAPAEAEAIFQSIYCSTCPLQAS